jgi:hypothetical protein
MTLRLAVAAALAAACCVAGVPRVAAAPGCPPGGAPPPPGAATHQISDVDGDDRPDTLWVGKWQSPNGAMMRAVGIATASGADSDVPVTSASPIPLRALAVDVQDGHQVIASLGRSAPLYAFVDCRLQTVLDSHYGRPFVFDLENLAGNGTGVGCREVGDERHLVALQVALQALGSGEQWTVRRTEINLNGLRASTGSSDTLTATSAHDPVVTTAQTISCGDLTIDHDGVQEP